MVVDCKKCQACCGVGVVERDGRPMECPGCIGEIRRLRDIALVFGFLPKSVLDQSPIKSLLIQPE